MLRRAGKLAPLAAVGSALASLACCLPWGVPALLGSFGIGIALEKHRGWLLALATVLLGLGAYSLARSALSCGRLRRGPLILMLCCAISVFVIALFPDALASFMVNHFR